MPTIYGPPLAANVVHPVAVTGNYTAQHNDLVEANCAAGAFTVTVPVTVGYRVVVKKMDAIGNLLTVIPSAGLIDGQASLILTKQWASVTLVGDGTNVQIESTTAATGSFKGVFTGAGYSVNDVVSYQGKLWSANQQISGVAVQLVGSTVCSNNATMPMPPGAAVGDIAVVGLHDFSTPTLASPWTSIRTAGGFTTFALGYYVLTSTDISNGYLPTPSTHGSFVASAALLLRNITTANLLIAQSASSYQDTGSPGATPSIVPTLDSMVVEFAGCVGTSISIAGPALGATNVFTPGGTNVCGQIAYELISANTAYPSRVTTGSVGSAHLGAIVLPISQPNQFNPAQWTLLTPPVLSQFLLMGA